MQYVRLLIVFLFLSALPCRADSSSSSSDPAVPRTFPGTIPEDCDVIDVVISLEKWVSYNGPFVDFDVPLDITCITSKVFHPLIHATVHLMCGEGERTLEWRFQGGGKSGKPIEELGNEIPAGKSVTPLKYHGFPATISGQEFVNFLEIYNNQISGGKLGNYSWNPDNYRCTKELNCGGYFLITFKALMGEHILEGSTEEIADEMKKGLKDCEHFAFELAGNSSQYDEALDDGVEPNVEGSSCTEEDFTSQWDKNCYLGPDNLCYEDPSTTFCSGVTQSRNPYAPCYLAPSTPADPEPTPQPCLGISCGGEPTPTPSPESTPLPRTCLGISCGTELEQPSVLDEGPELHPCAGAHCGVPATPTSIATEPTPIPCNGAAGTGGPCTEPTVTPTISPQPDDLICTGAVAMRGVCSVVVVPEVVPAASTPVYCNGITQSRNPKAPCYIAPQTQ